MKRWVLAGVLLCIATTTVVVPFAWRGVRGVHVLAEEGASTQFDPRQSAALFVGVSDFDAAAEVPFAVDDAVDLAHAFTLVRRCGLVPPGRVILILSKRSPAKKESGARLRELREAGVDIRYQADVEHVRAALREQAARAGRDGVLIVALAAHGLLHEGNGYILGASSSVRNLSSMLPTTELLETIASSNAQRSLVFIDACRERMTTGTRSVLASAMSAAPLMHRIAHTRGQAVFYAAAPGKWAYDDPEGRNGVFTEAVIAGISCDAAKSRGVVTAETLAGFVERYVQTWIRKNRDPEVGSATQWTMDGEVRNMPLAQCDGPPVGGPDRASWEGPILCAFEKNELLWQHDVGSAIAHAEVVDLDADGWREVVCATRHGITALDDRGKPLWSARESMTLTSCLVDEFVYQQRTKHVVALWNGEHASRLAAYRPDGKLLGAFDDDHRIDRVVLARPTARHGPKLVVTAGKTLMLFDSRHLAAGEPLWRGRVVTRSAIESLQIADGNGDGRSDIAVTTESGATVYVDFNGHAVRSTPGARFERLPRR
ncbi:MAG TPA: caspase family protein [Thermoanaerobaculia bacterium]|nr:caspase family protein [Thermoanaerobaculia bacterium]